MSLNFEFLRKLRKFGVVTATTDVVTGIVSISAGGSTYGLTKTVTWATKPAAAGNTGLVIRVTDVGPGAGSYWVSDGTYWRPLNGSVMLANVMGSLAAPVATLTSTTGSKFTLPADIVIPAAMMIPGQCMLDIWGLIHRDNNTATAIAQVHLGTGNTTSDNGAMGLSMAATDNIDVIAGPMVSVATATTYLTTNYLSRQSSGTAVFLDKTSAFNTASANYVNFAIGSANASDTFLLLAYSVTLRQ